MRAAVLDRYGEGAPSVRDFPDPVPAPGEALVRLRAAALNRVDLYMRGGGQGITHRLPLVLGLDGAGEVISAPPESGLSPGDRVQLYHLAGARVLATSSTPEKLAHAAALGAAVAIDYRTEDVPKRVLAETGGAGVDLVVDSVGAATWGQSLRAVRRGGRVVTCGATTGGDPSAELQRLFIRQIQVQGSTMGSLEEFRRLLAVVAAGRLRPAIERSFALEEAPAALDHPP